MASTASTADIKDSLIETKCTLIEGLSVSSEPDGFLGRVTGLGHLIFVTVYSLV